MVSAPLLRLSERLGLFDSGGAWVSKNSDIEGGNDDSTRPSICWSSRADGLVTARGYRMKASYSWGWILLPEL